jgi:hypothetical protein
MPALKLQLSHTKSWLSFFVFFLVLSSLVSFKELLLGVLFCFTVLSLLLSSWFQKTRLDLEVGWLLSAVLATLGTVVVFLSLPEGLRAEVLLSLEEALGSVKAQGGLYTLLTGRELTPQLILYQLPGFLAVYWLLSLFLSSQWERGLALFFQLNHAIPVKRLRFERLAWPDWVFWLFMISLGLSFIKFEPLFEEHFWLHLFGLNLFNFLAFGYCLQGLAVIESLMGYFRLPPAFKLGIYLVMILLLPFFFFLSSIGVLDYWIDFRQKVKRIKLERKP